MVRHAAPMSPATSFRAVVLDWRGTLVTTLTSVEWAEHALARAGLQQDEAAVTEVVDRLRTVQARLDDPLVDVDARMHRAHLMSAFADAGVEDDLALALYDVESDTTLNRFARDVAPTLTTLKERGLRVGVLSDIHLDVRPAFEAAGLSSLVDSFTLSFEHGAVKPDPALFAIALAALGTAPDETLMVGDRSGPDGGAVEAGITTLLLPPLRGVDDQRLGRVLALCPAVAKRDDAVIASA